ncbi:MAG TPA: DUF5655 domain-containing protein [Thermoanaerobaculia bacterium]|jgi:hypothetical protein|nr:DUF5655 domain-containing protein [Thermoanaerobaculia bacterium]
MRKKGQYYDMHPGLLKMGMGRESNVADYLAEAAQYVEAMFSGKKAALRPIYDALYDLARSYPGAKLSPGKTIVPIYRNHVVAQIKPATNTRIDFGFALNDTPVSGRLIDTGGLARKDRITHRIELRSVQEIDDEVRAWLRKAWEMDGEGER